jgi:hypothetical protein
MIWIAQPSNVGGQQSSSPERADVRHFFFPCLYVCLWSFTPYPQPEQHIINTYHRQIHLLRGCCAPPAALLLVVRPARPPEHSSKKEGREPRVPQCTHSSQALNAKDHTHHTARHHAQHKALLPHVRAPSLLLVSMPPLLLTHSLLLPPSLPHTHRTPLLPPPKWSSNCKVRPG